MENVRNREKTELIKKDGDKKLVKMQSKLQFTGVNKSHSKNDSYAFENIEELKEKPIYLRFTVLELSKLLKYAT